MQYVFAYDILGKLCFVGFPLAALIAVFLIIAPGVVVLTDLKVMALLLAVVILAILLGVLVGALFICIFLSPFYLAVERMNGGPFKGGERVYVISGKAKGMTTKVYTGWQGLSARIELGEEEKANFKDVYSSLSLIKIEETEQENA
jgi:hypothetical protein